jgi:c-di-GMP-binding flagellar brake protein YcgR
VVLRPDIPPLLLQDEIRQRLGIVERTAMRVNYRAPVRIGALGQQFESEMLDMSIGGMLVRSPAGLAIGTKVELTFDLPSRPGLSVVGAVVRSQRERGERAGRSGLAFVDLDAGARDAIRRFVQSHVAFREFFAWLKEAYFE